MYVAQECSTKWYIPRYWRGKKLRVLRNGHGFALGPIMFIRGKRSR